MNISFSYCKGGVPDNRDGKNYIKWSAWPKTITCDWETLLTGYLYKDYIVPHTYLDGAEVDRKVDGKTCLPTISGAVYPQGVKRCKENIHPGIQILILDVDNKGEKETQMSWEAGLAWASKTPYKVCLYTTYSHTEDRNKFRIVIPLTTPVHANYWGEFIQWAVTHLGLDSYREALDIPCMSKPAQVYFLKGAWDAQVTKIEWADGEPLQPPPEDELVCIQLPDEPTKRGRLEGSELKALQIYNVDMTTLDLVGVLRAKGVRIGQETKLTSPEGAVIGAKYRCHCPWPEQHTDQRDDDAAYVIEVDEKWPIFRCSHSNHGALGLLDLLTWAGPRVVALYGDPYQRPTGLKLQIAKDNSLRFEGAV